MTEKTTTSSKNTSSILTYSLYILLAGSAASILIDIDKFMIPQKQAINQTAFYAVAVFIATVVEIPGRAMFQIINPLVALRVSRLILSEIKFATVPNCSIFKLFGKLFFCSIR